MEPTQAHRNFHQVEDAASFDEARDDGFDVLPSHDELFMSHGDWMRLTHLTIGRRSSELRQLDEAMLEAERAALDIAYFDDEIEQYFQRGAAINAAEDVRDAMEKRAYALVLVAFQKWAKSAGNWRNSRRNNEQAPTLVYEQLRNLKKKYRDLRPDADELVQAERELTRLESEFVTQIFTGAKVQVRGADLSNVTQIASQASSIESVPGQLAKAGHAFEMLFTSHFGAPLHQVAQDPAWAQELAKVLPGLITEVHTLMEFVPVANVAVATASALSKLYDVHQTDHNRTQLLQVSEALPVCDARTALAAIKDWQEKYIRAQKSAAMQDAATAGVHLLNILVPGTQPIGAIATAAKSVVKMMDVFVDLGAQYRDSRKLENYLRNAPHITSDIFATCPLVGAYYVLNVPLSTFSLCLVPFESPTFQEDTEYMRNEGHMQAIMGDAERLLNASRYRLISPAGFQYRTTEAMSLQNAAKLKADHARKSVAGLIPRKARRSLSESDTDSVELTTVF